MKYPVYLLIIIGLTISCQTLHHTQKSFRLQKTKVVTILENNNPYSGLSEPSICINKTDSNNIIAGSIYDNVHVSNDQGKTWQTKQLHSPYGVFGDPCLASDYFGNIYYLHLADPDNNRNSPEFLSSIVIQKSTDKGKNWTNGTAIGYNNKHHQDKHWIGIHPKTGELAVTWTEFDQYNSKNPNDKSRILFSKSVDFGKTWTKPIKINQLDGDCLDDDNTVEGAVPVFDKQGNIYVAWAYHNKIYFDKSTDGGKTWLEKDIVVSNQPGGWNYDIPKVYRANGMPVLDIDNSGGKYDGSLYINWSDQRNGNDNTDIFICKSTDNGLTWSKPIKVNPDKTTTHQYLSWMKVDPVTGYIYIIYYDRSKYNDHKTDVSLSVSKDGGINFTTYTISEKPFKPRKNIFVGDYNNIDAFNGIVTPVWTDLNKNKISIKTTTLIFDH
jgi:Neuraminidase (sialidase)